MHYSRPLNHRDAQTASGWGRTRTCVVSFYVTDLQSAALAARHTHPWSESICVSLWRMQDRAILYKVNRIRFTVLKPLYHQSTHLSLNQQYKVVPFIIFYLSPWLFFQNLILWGLYNVSRFHIFYLSLSTWYPTKLG